MDSTGNVRMALKDNSFFAELVGSSPYSLSGVTVAANNNRALFIVTMVDAVSNSATGVSRNGQAGVAITGGNIAASTDVRLQHWVILNPTVGTFPVTATTSATAGGYLAAVSMYNTNQTTPNGTILSATYNTQANTLNLNAASVDDYALDFTGMSGTQVDSTQGAGQTEFFDTKTAYYRSLAASGRAGLAGTVAMSQTCSSSSPTAIVHSAFVVNDGGSTPPAATVPDAPTIGAATVASATSVSVAGTAPTNNGGAAIDLYRATASPSGVVATSATLPVLVTGLATGTAQTFRLEAHNTVGYSSQSAASNSATPAAGNAAPAFGGTIANISGTAGTAITPVDISTLFTDAGDTKAYSASPSGTAWPAGMIINASTGVISGTPTGSGTTTGCKVRDTDSASQTVDSNTFNFVIAAAVVNPTFAPSGALKNLVGAVLPDGSYSVIIRSKTALTAAPVAVKTGAAMVGGVIPSFSITGPVSGTEYVYEPVSEADTTIRGLARATPT
jgi:hypothetical protein